MSKRDYSLLFQDILDSINKILKYTLRMSDGTKIIGEINASATPPDLTILYETSNTEMVVLERIA